MYFLHKNDELSILAIVVDDILHVASSDKIVNEFANAMGAVYKLKNLGRPSLMVGINVHITPSAIRLNQSHYIRQVAETFRQLQAAPAQSPASQHGVLGPVPTEGEDLLDVSSFPYMSLVGCLLWITITRPDVAAAVSRACRHSKAPTVTH